MSAAHATPSGPVPDGSAPDGSAPGALARLIGPLGRDGFLERHWERAPLHVGRDRADHFADLVSVAAIEVLLARGEVRFPDLQLLRTGAPVPVEDYTDAAGHALARRVAHHHAEGATLVLSQAHRRLDALGALVRDLEHELGWRCQANVYLSPPGGSGFAPHHDTHDVFVLQAAGRKTFRFHTGGVDLPFPDERYDPTLAGPRDLEASVELGPGDTLYIPRGVAHDAVAADDGASLHVTLGVFPIVVRDLLIEAVRVAAERDVALRRSVAPDARSAGPDLPDGSDPAGREALVAALVAGLGGDAIAVALSRLRDEVAIGSVPDARGLLAASAPGPEPDVETVLVVDPAAPVRLERLGRSARLRRAGEVLEFDGAGAEAIEALLARGRLAVGELPGLAPERRVGFARRLLAQGICRAERPGHPPPVAGSVPVR